MPANQKRAISAADVRKFTQSLNAVISQAKAVSAKLAKYSREIPRTQAANKALGYATQYLSDIQQKLQQIPTRQ